MSIKKVKAKKKPVYYVASFSGGKDSTAMVLRLMELGYPLDEVLCCDTTMEFPAMYRHIEKVRAVVEAAGIKFTLLKAEHDFLWWLSEFQPTKESAIAKRKAEGRPEKGMGWPTARIRWCTKELKKKVIYDYLRTLRDKYCVIQYIGIATDEQARLARQNNQDPNHRHPLVEWGWTEADAMRYCRRKGYDWEGLYNLFKRVSCWCCPLQPLSELRTLRKHFPELWQHLKEIDAKSWITYKENATVADLEKRFDLEEALYAAGEKITNRAFYTDLKRLLAGEITAEGILQERQEKRTKEIAAKQIPGQQSIPI